jgi:RNA polymerase sigma-70 factor (ECF subfamily)
MDINRTAPRYEFADLVDEYSTSVYKFCRSLTYSKEDADDLLQDTFLKAFEQFSKASDNPQSFLFSTASFLWKSRKRKYARRNRLAPVEPLDDTLISGENVEDSFIEKEETRIVRQLVETLPEKLKTPVILYYTIEMSVQDIAQTLKIPAGTVKSRLFKARKIIEKGLIGYEK